MTNTPFILGTMRWGSWGAQWSTEEQSEKIGQAIELGLNHFDLADIYGNGNCEREFGKALELSRIHRDEITLISKCGIVQDDIKHYNTTYEYIRTAAKKSIEALKVDYLDMLLIHRPDPLMVPEEIAHAFQSLTEEGLLRAAGTSNFLPHQWEMVHRLFPMETNQIEWSLGHLDPIWNGQLDQMTRYNKQPQIWGPLGGGKLTEVAEAPETLAWIKRHPSKPLPVVGSTKPERWESLIAGIENEMERARWFEILEKARGRKIE